VLAVADDQDAVPDGVDSGDRDAGYRHTGAGGSSLRGDGYPPADAYQADRRSDVVDGCRELEFEAGGEAQGHGEPPDCAGGADDPGFVAQLGHGAPAGLGQPVLVRNAEAQGVVAKVPLAQPSYRTWMRRADARHDRHVQMAAQHRVRARLVGRGDQPYLNLRELPANLHQGMAHDLRPLTEWDADPQQPAHGQVVPGQRRFRGAQFDEDPFGVLHQRAPSRREGNPVPAPLDQGGSRLALQRRQLLRYR